MRMRSPSSAPCVNGDVGSMATMPSVLPRRAVLARERAGERALAGARRTGEADRVRLAGSRVEQRERAPAGRRVVLDQGERAAERAAVAGQQPLDEVFDVGHRDV